MFNQIHLFCPKLTTNCCGHQGRSVLIRLSDTEYLKQISGMTLSSMDVGIDGPWMSGSNSPVAHDC